jgi:ferric-dicitrate binding protein FerR (iron transport regulator)
MNIPIYDRLAELAFKKISGRLSEEEEQELKDIFEKSPDQKELFHKLTNPAHVAAQLRIMDELDVDASWEKFIEETRPHPKRWGWKQYLVAASIVLIIGSLGLYLLYSKDNKTAIVKGANKSSTGNTVIKDSAAMIVGADGTEVLVGKDQEGIVAYIEDKPVQIKDGILIIPEIESAGPILRSLPGKELQVQLSDGTRVWLSGSSELNFHKGFAAAKRTLALKGEGYFEVIKKGRVPFTVRVGDMDATVMGTMFTISAYENGPVTTSLFEGKVNLSAGEKNMVLSKNEEAIWANNEFSKRALPKTSEDKMKGKKDGNFLFEDKIKTVLDEVAKIYNCEIVYKGDVPDKEYIGKFPRNMPIDSLLRHLSTSMVIDLTLQGNKIVADFTKFK